MADVDPKNPTTETTVVEEGKNEAKGETTPKTFTQEEVDKIAAKTRAEAKAQAEKDKAQAIAEAKAEAERLAKLSEEERVKAIQQKDEAERTARENQITLRENRADAIEKLQELGLPKNLVDIVLTTDKEAMGKNIESLHSAFSEAVEAGIKTRLAGNPPKDPKTPANPTTEKQVVNYF